MTIEGDLIKKLANKKIVLVGWLDSLGVTSEWQFLEELTEFECVIAESVGVVIYEDKKVLVLAGHWVLNEPKNSGQVTGLMTIPKKAILYRRALVEKEITNGLKK